MSTITQDSLPQMASETIVELASATDSEEMVPTLLKPSAFEGSPDEDVAETPEETVSTLPKQPSSTLDDHAGQHPELIKMCVVDASRMTRIVPNSEPVPIETELFSGHVFMMIRTPDVDEPNSTIPLGENPERISQYLKGKLRRFEFQFQIKLKKVPTGPLFLGCEVEHPIKISRFVKGLSSVLLAMCRRINPGFHYSWGIDTKHKNGVNQEAIQEGRYEKTHVSFPVEASMDRVIISKPGETPPELGHELFETPESVKHRRKSGAGCIDWNCEDTYTMCLWSAYFDWLKWKCMNVPGVRPFSLCSVTSTQPVYLSVYELKGISNEEYRKKKPPHNRQDLNVYARFEFSNAVRTEGGLSNKILGGKFEPLETDTELMDVSNSGASDTASDSGHVSA